MFPTSSSICLCKWFHPPRSSLVYTRVLAKWHFSTLQTPALLLCNTADRMLRCRWNRPNVLKKGCEFGWPWPISVTSPDQKPVFREIQYLGGLNVWKLMKTYIPMHIDEGYKLPIRLRSPKSKTLGRESVLLKNYVKNRSTSGHRPALSFHRREVWSTSSERPFTPQQDEVMLYTDPD